MDAKQRATKRTDPVTYALREGRALGHSHSLRWLKVSNGVSQHHKNLELGNFYLKGYAKPRVLGKRLDMVVIKSQHEVMSFLGEKEQLRTNFTIYLPKADEFVIFWAGSKATQDIRAQLLDRIGEPVSVALVEVTNKYGIKWWKPLIEGP